MKKLLTLIAVLSVGFTACTEFEEPVPVAEVEDTTSEPDATIQTRASGGVIQFEKMANPFKLEVMQDVYDTHSLSPVTLQPTHLYVRIIHRHRQLWLSTTLLSM
jgi:hypothetical protein